MKQILPILNFKGTNWDNFQEEIGNKISNINLGNNSRKHGINDKFGQWYNITKSAINNSIPTKSQTVEHKSIFSPH